MKRITLRVELKQLDTGYVLEVHDSYASGRDRDFGRHAVGTIAEVAGALRDCLVRAEADAPVEDAS